MEPNTDAAKMEVIYWTFNSNTKNVWKYSLLYRLLKGNVTLQTGSETEPGESRVPESCGSFLFCLLTFLVPDAVLGTAGVIMSKTVLLLTGFLFSRGCGQTTANHPEWDPQGPV